MDAFWKLTAVNIKVCLYVQLVQEGMNEMFYLTIHSTYLRFDGVKHMVNHHSDSDRGKPLPAHGILFSISSKVSFICIIPHTTDNIYHCFCYTIRGALAGTRNNSMGPTTKDRPDDPSHHERTLLPRSYLSLRTWFRVRHVNASCAFYSSVLYVPQSAEMDSFRL